MHLSTKLFNNNNSLMKFSYYYTVLMLDVWLYKMIVTGSYKFIKDTSWTNYNYKYSTKSNAISY